MSARWMAPRAARNKAHLFPTWQSMTGAERVEKALCGMSYLEMELCGVNDGRPRCRLCLAAERKAKGGAR